jgi:hypothetical protein
VSFTAAGSLTSLEDAPAGSSSSYSLTTHAAGNWVLLETVVNSTSATAVSGGLGGGTWTQLSTTVSLPNLGGTGGAGFGSVWAGKVVSAGTANVTVTFGASLGGNNSRFVAREFSVTSGNIAFDVQGAVTSATANWASLAPAVSGELYWGYCEDGSSAVAGSTTGFVYETDAHGNGEGYCLSVSAAYQPVWGDSTMQAGVMVLIREVTAVTAPPQPSSRRTEVISRVTGRAVRR